MHFQSKKRPPWGLAAFRENVQGSVMKCCLKSPCVVVRSTAASSHSCLSHRRTTEPELSFPSRSSSISTPTLGVYCAKSLTIRSLTALAVARKYNVADGICFTFKMLCFRHSTSVCLKCQFISTLPRNLARQSPIACARYPVLDIRFYRSTAPLSWDQSVFDLRN